MDFDFYTKSAYQATEINLIKSNNLNVSSLHGLSKGFHITKSKQFSFIKTTLNLGRSEERKFRGYTKNYSCLNVSGC
jgi:hypothetical protein